MVALAVAHLPVPVQSSSPRVWQPANPLQDILRARATLGRLLDTLPLIQAECPHKHVGHSVDADLLPVRVCFRCGLEEAGSPYSTETSWSRRHYDGLATLRNEPTGRTVQALDWVEFQRLRIGVFV